MLRDFPRFQKFSPADLDRSQLTSLHIAWLAIRFILESAKGRQNTDLMPTVSSPLMPTALPSLSRQDSRSAASVNEDHCAQGHQSLRAPFQGRPITYPRL
jgi:hypothetical protein